MKRKVLNEIVLNRELEGFLNFEIGPSNAGIVENLWFSRGLIGHGYLAV